MSQCAELLYRFIWKVCVWTGQSEQSKPLEAGQELKQSVSDRGKNPGKNSSRLYEKTNEFFEHQIM